MIKPWTDGPWELCWEDGKHGVIAEAADKKLVCIIGNNPDDDKNDIRKANAQLISKAPEMAEQLEANTQWLVAERDSLYACITDPDGNITDGEDREYLADLDRIIDRNRALLAEIQGVTA